MSIEIQEKKEIEMTKQQMIEKLENRKVKVLFARMDNGKPKATIEWEDYMKVRYDADLYKEYSITFRMR